MVARTTTPSVTQEKRSGLTSVKTMDQEIDISVNDISVKGKTPNGKLMYGWLGKDGDYVVVEATPRDNRGPIQSESYEFTHATFRESTPERAVREIKARFLYG